MVTAYLHDPAAVFALLLITALITCIAVEGARVMRDNREWDKNDPDKG